MRAHWRAAAAIEGHKSVISQNSENCQLCSTLGVAGSSCYFVRVDAKDPLARYPDVACLRNVLDGVRPRARHNKESLAVASVEANLRSHSEARQARDPRNAVVKVIENGERVAAVGGNDYLKGVALCGEEEETNKLWE